MKNKFTTMSGLVLVGLMIYFVFSLTQVFFLTVGKNVVICNNCLSTAIPSILGRSLIFLSLLSFISVCFSLFRRSLFQRSLIKLRNKPRFVVELENKHSLQRRIVLFKSKKPLAFCLGYAKPKIYLSAQLFKVMTRSEIEAIVLHEKQHIVKQDNLKLSVLYVFRSAFFFFPIIGDLVNNIELKQEINADKQTIQIVGKEPLITALRKVIESPSVNLTFIKSFSQSFDIKPRINYLIQGKTSSFHFGTQNLILTLGVLFLFLNIFVSRIETHQTLRTDTILCLDKGNCLNSCSVASY